MNERANPSPATMRLRGTQHLESAQGQLGAAGPPQARLAVDKSGATPRRAEVLEAQGRLARVLCPYCGRAHTHRDVVGGVLEHRAAPCPLGTPIPTAWRAAGYTFRVALPPRRRRTN